MTIIPKQRHAGRPTHRQAPASIRRAAWAAPARLVEPASAHLPTSRGVLVQPRNLEEDDGPLGGGHCRPLLGMRVFWVPDAHFLLVQTRVVKLQARQAGFHRESPWPHVIIYDHLLQLPPDQDLLNVRR
eukprot:CAMPEP_0175752592 /NCGR_PEP_ID=MMETSP0097-20121207/61850_1 /TAXON_ID=311494 /ORGANISM="Alexandrium monilatum, Strain CCMP3105" /LENGTH=128 /DNA_ID=CAMNT_0017061393 /DNA_START=82 /DNA_END=466 /DNA_ORIENTATION=-